MRVGFKAVQPRLSYLSFISTILRDISLRTLPTYAVPVEIAEDVDDDNQRHDAYIDLSKQLLLNASSKFGSVGTVGGHDVLAASTIPFLRDGDVFDESGFWLQRRGLRPYGNSSWSRGHDV